MPPCRPVRTRQRGVARSDPAVDESFGQPILGQHRLRDHATQVAMYRTYIRTTHSD